MTREEFTSTAAALRASVEDAAEETKERVEARLKELEDQITDKRDELVEDAVAKYKEIEDDFTDARDGLWTKLKGYAAAIGVKRAMIGVAVLVGLVSLYSIFGSDSPETPQDRSGAPVGVLGGDDTRSSSLVPWAGVYAERVFYRGGASAEWGTFCKYSGGYLSAEHVTRNGLPKVGPTASVTYQDADLDFAVIGIDPATVQVADIPVMSEGDTVYTAGFPAGDRSGEVKEARVLVDTGNEVWITLVDEFGIAEGFVGGESGSCVLNENLEVVGVLTANSFSSIAGTQNAHGLVTPLRKAIRSAQGMAEPTALLAGGKIRNDMPPIPRRKPLTPSERETMFLFGPGSGI